MKFQIFTNIIITGNEFHTHEAMCWVPPWINNGPVRMLGISEEDAKDRVVEYIQRRLNNIGTSNMFEVDLVPNNLGEESK